MKFSPSQKLKSHQGFTLIELLVVIAIIGILAGLLLPAVFSGLRRSKEFVIEKNMLDLKGAMESFKNEYGVFPIDFAIDPQLAGNNYAIYQNLVSEFVDRLSPRHAYGNAGYTIFAPGQQLENPYFGVIPGSPEVRNPATLSASEAYVFFLYELSENAEFPLGYVFDSNAGVWVIDPNRQAKSFYAFKDDKLTDLDLDGWPEFCPDAGPKIPFCYFDSRTYQQMQYTPMVDGDGNGVDDSELKENLLNMIKIDETDHRDAGAGWCYPYLDFFQSNKNQRYVFEEPDSFQLISAGMDGAYGKGAGEFPGLRYSKNDDGGLIIDHRDNLVSFREGRLENDFVTN